MPFINYLFLVSAGLLREVTTLFPFVFLMLAACNRFDQTTPSSTFEIKMTEVAEHKVVVIQGIFDQTGDNLLEIKSVNQYSYSYQIIPDQSSGHFLVKVIYVSGDTTIIPFDALVADDAGHTIFGFFEVTVPVNGEIKEILITNDNGEKIFTHIESSHLMP